MDFAVLADHRVKLKEYKMRDKIENLIKYAKEVCDDLDN